MDLISKIGVIMVIGGMLVTILGIVMQILAMAIEELW